MNSPPRVSIVLPTYNGERYLRESLESCLMQTFVDWELIVVDDASTDSTPAILGSYAERDSRIRVIRNPGNRKLPASLNIGFRQARGELLTWTSDDNLYRENALEVMVDELGRHPDADIVYASYSIIDDEGKVRQRVGAEPVEMLAVGNIVNACFLYRRNVQQVLGGYDEGLFLVEDYDFWLRAASRFVLHPIEKDLYLYRRHENNLTSKRQHDIDRAIAALLAARLPKIGWLSARARAAAYERLMGRACRLQNNSLARKCFCRLLLASPRAVARLPIRYIAAVILGPQLWGGIKGMCSGTEGSA